MWGTPTSSFPFLTRFYATPPTHTHTKTRYLHPKQVYIANGILHPELAEKKSLSSNRKKSSRSKENHHGNSNSHPPKVEKLSAEDLASHGGLTFVYPYGASLNVSRPSLTVLSSGPIAFPLNRPICSVYESPVAGSEGVKGRVVVLGSSQMFGDEYLDKEENGKLLDVLMKYCCHEDGVELERTREPELEVSAKQALGGVTVTTLFFFAQLHTHTHTQERLTLPHTLVLASMWTVVVSRRGREFLT